MSIDAMELDTCQACGHETHDLGEGKLCRDCRIVAGHETSMQRAVDEANEYIVSSEDSIVVGSIADLITEHPHLFAIRFLRLERQAEELRQQFDASTPVKVCRAEFDGYLCTRLLAHDGQHVAHDCKGNQVRRWARVPEIKIEQVPSASNSLNGAGVSRGHRPWHPLFGPCACSECLSKLVTP